MRPLADKYENKFLDIFKISIFYIIKMTFQNIDASF